MLRTPVLTALVMIPLVLAALFMLSPRRWGLAVLAVVLVAAHEWSELSGFTRTLQFVFIAVILFTGVGLLFLPAAGFARGWPPAVAMAGCGLSGLFWVLLAPEWVSRRWPTTISPAMVCAGWVVLIGAWISLVELQARSPWLVLAAMAIVWIADTAAYFTGRAFGRRKLAPEISPGKTWEGVYGALVAVALYVLLVLTLAPVMPNAPLRPLEIAACIVVAVLIAGISVLGDLFESLMKRHAGVKDSGKLLPGHGGVLDRTDALLAAMPLAAFAVLLFVVKP